MAAAALGALAARARPAELAAVVAYAKNLGLAFQIVDDLIDVDGRAPRRARTSGKDVKKTTFVSFSGVDGARALAAELVAASQAALEPFGPRAAAAAASSPATSSPEGGRLRAMTPLPGVRVGPGARRLRARRGRDDQLSRVRGRAAGDERRADRRHGSPTTTRA